jgi:hypothetical protein
VTVSLGQGKAKFTENNFQKCTLKIQYLQPNRPLALSKNVAIIAIIAN